MTIGRVVITQKEPAKPYEFWCWLKNDPSVNVEVGTILIAEGDSGEKALALVEDMQSTSAASDHLLDFYGSGYGNPDIDPPTRPTLIRLAKLRALYREPSTASPPTGRWRVRFAQAADVNLLAQRIPERYRVLAGFLRVGSDETDPGSWLPVFAHAQFLLGPEGAHVNITGATGLATKSSYALFLSYAVLSWAKKAEENVAVVLFNVKRRDFLSLHQLPEDWDEADQWCHQWAASIGETNLASRVQAMWKQAKEQGVDPIAHKFPVRYFTYQGDPDRSSMQNPQIYSYGFDDLERGDFEAALFTAAYSSTDPQVILLTAYLDAKLGQGTSFQTMEQDLDRRNLIKVSGSNEVQVRGVSGSWMSGVPPALGRRLSGFLSRASHVVEKNQPHGQPFSFSALVPYGLHVIQLYRLTEEEKRLAVNAVIRKISQGLEGPDRHIDRVLVIADELNKYAPSGAMSPMKEQIIDVVARGRDLQLTLIGAQQFASQVDDQVYGNSETKVVGYSDESELTNSIYKYLVDLRAQVPNLKKGQLILRHPVYPSPLIFWFPTPLHEMKP
ncbi:hypothetical protein NET02_00885 [Thermomicrobiaceae bacterium CFH 74404]|uniref:ATP-binding protein n=1 Tax=Thermalbibacter longus TaxID=2951981 RepID=A0AA41WCW9_9BACT|nr:hypothetical protein [Thermalbibacter longus]MCM8747695.1 hypothetical protein [Thermalbibacter longus]